MLNKELEIVSWYMEVLESGVDTKTLVQDHAALLKKHSKLKKKTTNRINQLEEDLEKANKQVRSTMKKLEK